MYGKEEEDFWCDNQPQDSAEAPGHSELKKWYFISEKSHNSRCARRKKPQHGHELINCCNLSSKIAKYSRNSRHITNGQLSQITIAIV